MIWLDWVILGIIVLSMFQGARVGAAERVIQIVAVIIALSECWRIAPWIRDNVLQSFDINFNVAKLLALVLGFLVFYLLIWGVGSWLTSFLSAGLSGLINRILGAILGLVIAIYGMGYVFLFVDKVGPTPTTLAKYELNDVRPRSKFYVPIRESIADIEGLKAYLSPEEREHTPSASSTHPTKARGSQSR